MAITELCRATIEATKLAKGRKSLESEVSEEKIDSISRSVTQRVQASDPGIGSLNEDGIEKRRDPSGQITAEERTLADEVIRQDPSVAQEMG